MTPKKKQSWLPQTTISTGLSEEEEYNPQNQHNLHKESTLRRYQGNGGAGGDQTGHYHRRPHNSDNMSDSASSKRYCSDPFKMLGVNTDFNGDDLTNLSVKREAQVGNIKLQLPLDEDDYLMPSPQQSQGVTPYMDLIGDAKLSDGATNAGYGNYPDFLQAHSLMNSKYIRI